MATSRFAARLARANVTRHDGMASFTETIKRKRICPTGSIIFQYPSDCITDDNGDHGYDDARSRQYPLALDVRGK
jgi:hypothetical protein